MKAPQGRRSASLTDCRKSVLIGVYVDRITVACVQQQMRLHDSLEAYREDLRRFLRVAQGKQAHLVLFPELAGAMVMPPLLRDLQSTLLKRADRGRRKQASLWQRLTGAAAYRLGGWLGADLRRQLAALLATDGADIWSTYATFYSDLAREFAVVLVAPSAYLPDPADQVIRNIAGVFGADGALLGSQSKVILHTEDEGLAQPGEGWQPIPTPVGVLGLMLGNDVLFPEVGRVLAYQGVEVLLMLGSATTPVLYQKLRAGLLARMQDNQLFAATSFVVGHNELGRQRTAYAGKSAIFAPQELTPRFNGVLVEMGSQRSEGVLAAEWNFVTLKQLWESSDTPVRRQLAGVQAGQVLAKLYERLRSLPGSELAPELLDDAAGTEHDVAGLLGADQEVLTLDDLPVIGVVTRRWPGLQPGRAPIESPLDLSELPEQLTQSDADQPDAPASLIAVDDETDEMDALPEESDSPAYEPSKPE